jgi:DnaJ-class molecular chaperone
MADHYQTLGVNKGATQDEIKKAYRKLASQHHPDKGGDTKKFQEVEEAYRTLSDPGTRAQYDNPNPFGTRPDGGWQQAGGFPPGFEDIFAHFGGGHNPFGDMFGQRRAPPRNRTLNIQTSISLEEAFQGKDLIANLQLPNGKDQTIEVKIPAGIRDGTTLRLAGMGEDNIPGAPRGDIHLTITILPHLIFRRNNDDLIRTVPVSCIDAMLGKKITVDTIDGKTLEIAIAPGTQHGTVLGAHGYGMPNMNDIRYVGRMLLEVQITIPTNLTDAQKDILKNSFN